MKRWALPLLALAVAGCGAQAQVSSTAAIRIDAAPVTAAAAAFAGDGRAASAGVLHLTSPDTARLHGLSDLAITEDGRLTAVSDEGDLLTARLRLDPDATLAGLTDATITPILGLDGRPVAGKSMGDAEGVAVWPNGDLTISFERNHRIWLYPAGGGAPREIPRPAVDMPDNEGMEGLSLAPSRGPDAYWVGIEAGRVWLCRLQGACVEQPGVPRPGLGRRLSGLTETPRGELVLLHHSYNPLTKASGLTAVLVRPDPTGTRTIARLSLADPRIIDNYEGVQAAALPGGGLRLFLLSDDNVSDDQRTLFTAIDWYPEGR